MLYHVSFEKRNSNNFVPRIPFSCCSQFEENNIIKRICLSSSIEGCLTAIPEVGLGYLNDLKSRGVRFLFYVYSIDESLIDQSNIITPNELLDKKLVFDATYSNEHWVINQEIVFDEPKLMRVISLDEKKVTIPTFTNQPFDIRLVSNLKLESTLEPFGRAYEYHFANEEDFCIIRDLAEKIGCKIVNHGTFNQDYFYFLNFYVPAGIDIKAVWEEYLKIRLKYLEEFESEDFIECEL